MVSISNFKTKQTHVVSISQGPSIGTWRAKKHWVHSYMHLSQNLPRKPSRRPWHCLRDQSRRHVHNTSSSDCCRDAEKIHEVSLRLVMAGLISVLPICPARMSKSAKWLMLLIKVQEWNVLTQEKGMSISLLLSKVPPPDADRPSWWGVTCLKMHLHETEELDQTKAGLQWLCQEGRKRSRIGVVLGRHDIVGGEAL